MWRLRKAPFDISRNVRRDGTGPLLRGDRLRWIDDESGTTRSSRWWVTSPVPESSITCACGPSTARRSAISSRRRSPLACEEKVVSGDRIRWTLVRHSGTGFDPVDGDTPRIEAVVEAVEPGISDMVTLRVIRSWGMAKTPEAGSTIRQEMRTLLMRGCFRAPWDDEAERAERMAETLRENETRRRGRSRGLSM